MLAYAVAAQMMRAGDVGPNSAEQAADDDG